MLFMLVENNNMDLDLREKQVLITGGTRGIGLASAKAFAKEGCGSYHRPQTTRSRPC